MVKFPAQLHDTLDALARVHRTIERYGGDPQRLFLGGHSAGGHLAALATLRRDALAGRGLPQQAIRACLPISAPYDLASDDPMRQRKVAAFLETPEQVAAASPITLVAGNRIPFLITYGTADLPELPPQAVHMATALREAHSPVEVLELQGRTHFDTHEDCGVSTSPWLEKARALLRAA
jgi:acetyl esterase/lipase